MGSASRGCCGTNPGGFPGIYGKPRLLPPSDGPTTVVVSFTTASYMLVTTSVTATVLLIVSPLEDISCVAVEVRVARNVVVSYSGRVVTTDVADALDKMVVVTWTGVV